MKFLYDLVTVIRECVSFVFTPLMPRHWEGEKRVMIFQPGNLPVVWYRNHSRSRGIGRTVFSNAKLHFFGVQILACIRI